MSGHSKWATIKRKKGALDAKRGQLFTKLIKEITVAARMGGGDPDGNARLRKAINNAKGQAMPADTIKRAVAKGTGELEGVNYEEILYEGTGPGGTLFLVESMTDNKNRTVAEIRKIFEKNNGVMGAGGTAGWAFDRRGIILLAKESATEDQLMEIAAGAGADDYSDQGEEWQVLSEVSAMDAVVKALEDAKIPVKSSYPGYVPKNKKPTTGRDAEVALNLAEALDDHDDVQHVYSDFDISDEEMDKMAE
jgi:YebC/PmpR family DNA-binding regulatory protein